MLGCVLPFLKVNINRFSKNTFSLSCFGAVILNGCDFVEVVFEIYK